MKSLGIIRKIDPIGRITLPKSIRQNWGIEHNDGLEIAVEGDSIILSKYQTSCAFCGAIDDVIEYKEKHICEECLTALRQQAR